MKIRDRELDFVHQGYVMGILNVTPDSFSDGGRFHEASRAIEHALQMVEEGASIIDIGGESTRPGHKEVSAEEEQARILPVIEGIRKHSDCLISVDTYKSETLEVALQAGADIANDVWGMMKDPHMAEVVVRHECPVILMHNKDNNHYDNVVEDLLKETQAMVDMALAKGVAHEKIILDPGLGFALSYAKDLAVLRAIDRLVALGYPVLLGASRKRFIGKATGVEVAKDRIIGTCATTCWGRSRGVGIFRVHDVKANKEALDMMDAIIQGADDGSDAY